jgi:hypothetical protein
MSFKSFKKKTKRYIKLYFKVPDKLISEKIIFVKLLKMLIIMIVQSID